MTYRERGERKKVKRKTTNERIKEREMEGKEKKRTTKQRGRKREAIKCAQSSEQQDQGTAPDQAPSGCVVIRSPTPRS